MEMYVLSPGLSIGLRLQTDLSWPLLGVLNVQDAIIDYLHHF